METIYRRRIVSKQQEKEMIEEIVQKLTEHLYSGSKEFFYMGYRFEIEEDPFISPMDLSISTSISIKVPTYICSHYTRTFQNIYSVRYNKCPGMEKKEHFLRIDACARLAREFVTVALPKIDYEIEKELHNRKIDEILEVLE